MQNDCVLNKSKQECKDQESIRSSTTPDPGYQWESDKLKVIQYTTNDSQEVSPFPAAGDHNASTNRRARRHNNHKTEKTYKIHIRSTTSEQSVKYFTGRLKPVSSRQPYP